MKKFIILICSFAVLFILAVGFFGYKLYDHENKQNAYLESLQTQVNELRAGVVPGIIPEVEIDDTGLMLNDLSGDDYYYLAIGNSITTHEKTTYWWNKCGMAASDTDHDYYHLVLKYLKEHVDGKVVSDSFGFSFWETLSHDRNEMLPQLDPYLGEKVDLVTIQLGENAMDLSTYESDYVDLIEYIQDKSPNAKIIVVGDFWFVDGRDALKESAVKKTGVEYASIEYIVGNGNYQCGLGRIVYDDEGNEHTVEHEGVAIHPSDEGMKVIADSIIAVLKKSY